MGEKEPQCDRKLTLGIRSKENVCKIWKGHNHRKKQKGSLEPREDTEKQECRDVHKWPVTDIK